MPNGIVTEIKNLETCPAPECNLSSNEVEQFVEELNSYTKIFEPAFPCREQWERSQTYLEGLMGNSLRKNVERMALEMGENVRDLQHFVGQSPWKKEPVVMIHQGLIAEMLSEEDGVALVDESGNVKQGQFSVVVAAQYCGSVGKVANSQVGVDVGYVSRKGYTLVDSQLFMPDEWFDAAHAELRKECGIPEDLTYQTKPEIALKLLQGIVERNQTLAEPLIFRWVAADALYGDSIAFRDGVAELGKWYFTEIKSTLQVWLQRPEVYVPEWKGHGRQSQAFALTPPD